jgi:hypothetical protein
LLDKASGMTLLHAAAAAAAAAVGFSTAVEVATP